MLALVLHPAVLAESFACAFANGWWDDCLTDGVTPGDATHADIDRAKVWRVVPEKIALIHSEVSEALEDLRVRKMTTVCRADGKPEGYPSELADIVIRIYDLMGALGVVPDDESATFDEDELPPNMGDAGRLAFTHLMCSSALQAYWGDAAPDQLATCLGDIVYDVVAVAARSNIDLHYEILAKQAFNRTRPHRHGDKAF